MAWYNWFHTVKTSIKLDVPKWQYCNHINPSNPGVGLTQCCRFATKIKARGATSTFTCCTLHNQPLATEFEMVKKCDACWKATRSRSLDLSIVTNPEDPSYNSTAEDLFVDQVARRRGTDESLDYSYKETSSHKFADVATLRRRAKEVKAIAVPTVSAFIATYKSLRTSGLSESLALNTAKTEVLDNVNKPDM